MRKPKTQNSNSRRQRALIVGGGSGLGLASSLALAAEGWEVFITGRREEILIQAQAQHPVGSCHWKAGDATSEVDASSVMRSCIDTMGGLDALVISAGMSAVGSVLESDLAQMDAAYKSNVLPTFIYTRYASPHLSVQGGAICVIASIAGSLPQPNRIAYCTSKAAVLGMVRQMALDLASSMIRVNAVSPSLVLTELSQNVINASPNPEAVLAARIRSHPLGRIGNVQEVGCAVAYLCSQDASWITGQDLVLDGGRGLMAGVPQ